MLVPASPNQIGDASRNVAEAQLPRLKTIVTGAKRIGEYHQNGLIVDGVLLAIPMRSDCCRQIRTIQD